MGYYSGDYYRGDYYTGDPGLLGGALKLFKGAARLTPAGSALSLIPAIARRGHAQAVKSKAVSGPFHRGEDIVVRPRGVAMARGQARQLGLLRHRRMNPYNPKALRRAVRRAQSFAKMARKVLRFVSPQAPRGRAIFKSRKRKR